MVEVSRFDEFWAAWPGNGSKGYEAYTRKKDRVRCEQKWKQHKFDEQADVILHDVEIRKKYDKAWRQQDGAFLCAPLVYLNNRRWLDGDFADVRDERQKSVPAPRRSYVDDSPPMSRWGRGANRILFKCAYANGRGLTPLGPELLSKLLARKAEIVKDAELLAAEGVPMPDEHFVKSTIAAFEALIRG